MNIDEVVGKIEPDKDYKLKEIAGMFDITNSALMGAVARGKLKGRKIFSKWYIKGRDIRAYLLDEKC
jgi:predicted DNA-binding protein YlxM (UPF0122 family)